jgi:hypothetical protein
MKKVLTLVFIAFCISAKSQITLDHSFNVFNLEIVNFSNTNLGEKLVSNTEQPSFYSHQDTITIYNTDYSLYKVIPVPVNYIYSDLYSLTGLNIPSVSDELFNSDTALEYIAAKMSTSGANFYSVINESGQILFTFPDSVFDGINITKIGNSFKVISRIGGSNSNTPYMIYSLPGSIPCNQCSGITSGIEDPGNNGIKMGFNAYPNPFNSTLNINYNMSSQQNAKIVLTDMLGQELMSTPATRQSDNLNLSTAGLPSGMIVISLIGANGQMISKKLIKIQ